MSIYTTEAKESTVIQLGEVAAGIYFIRLERENELLETKKLIIVD